MPKWKQKIRVQLHQKKKVSEKFNIEDTAESIELEAERFLLLFEKACHEYHEKCLKDKNINREDGVVTDFLTKVAKKIREHILSDTQGTKAAKFLQIIDSFFQPVFNSNQNGKNRLGVPPRCVNNFENRRTAAARESKCA